MFKKIVIAVIIVAVLIVASVLLWQQYGPKTEVGPKTTGLPMKVARYYWPGEYWIEIADKKGWFEEAGLNVKLVDTNPDWYGSLTDMVEGRIDVNNFSLFDLMQFVIKKNDLVMVINTDMSMGSEILVARPEIQTIRDLKGKRVGVAVGSYMEYILDVVLGRSGLGSNDITKVNVIDEKIADKFLEENMDAAMSWDLPVVEIMIKQQGMRKLFDTSEISGISPNGQVFHKSFIKERPEDVQAYINV